MDKKKFNPNHTAESLNEALGIDREAWSKMRDAAIKAYNGKSDDQGLSAGIEAAAKVIRAELLGETDIQPSQYELVLGAVLFSMGKDLIKSQLHQALDATLGSGMPKVIAMAALIPLVIDIASEGKGGHECTKCGKCGKTFDADGKETGGPERKKG